MSSASSTSLGRRGYLTLLGVSVTTPMLAGRALSAEGTGYGVGGYGDRVYGDTEEDEEVVEDENEDEEVPTAEPAITKLNLRDTSNPRNPHVDMQVDWAASIDDGELALMELWVERHDGVRITVVTEDLEGEVTSGVETTRIHQGAGEQYVVRLRMTSGYDTQTTELESIET
ncbi:hypothetical protein HUB97_13725 [Halorubraceae archaeon YAN]|nr:hypothetical protein [Halorubraceae archaeon YAN]